MVVGLLKAPIEAEVDPTPEVDSDGNKEGQSREEKRKRRKKTSKKGKFQREGPGFESLICQCRKCDGSRLTHPMVNPKFNICLSFRYVSDSMLIDVEDKIVSLSHFPPFFSFHN